MLNHTYVVRPNNIKECLLFDKTGVRPMYNLIKDPNAAARSERVASYLQAVEEARTFPEKWTPCYDADELPLLLYDANGLNNEMVRVVFLAGLYETDIHTEDLKDILRPYEFYGNTVSDAAVFHLYKMYQGSFDVQLKATQGLLAQLQGDIAYVTNPTSKPGDKLNNWYYEDAINELDAICNGTAVKTESYHVEEIGGESFIVSNIGKDKIPMDFAREMLSTCSKIASKGSVHYVLLNKKTRYDSFYVSPDLGKLVKASTLEVIRVHTKYMHKLLEKAVTQELVYADYATYLWDMGKAGIVAYEQNNPKQ